jgi:hypothetical protein
MDMHILALVLAFEVSALIIASVRAGAFGRRVKHHWN